ILLDLCVISQYQELKDGRGTRITNTAEESPVMYIAVSDRMTLPFSREGSEGAAMYTSRVPSPEFHLDNILNPNNCMGSKSVEPSRRWTSIDYEYPIRPHSSAAGSYVQNLGQQDIASTHTESTFFFPINNNDEPESENALATVPSAPSEYGSFAPVGRALSYPSTPANNTPYLSATMNRKPMVEMRASSRSLSHLEVAGKQQPAEYFGARRLVPPPHYHTLSSYEKMESIV
ncbi:uncharacterized protein LOC117115930, partial [Anneissia japonica]|uniref:uncharacterized protein LOC117115930 n=1 Tax=Anneissia japonica TaxID=1529436 RepID=UPI0014258DA5